MEAKTSVEFLLPPTCTSTRRDESFVLFDGKTDRDVRKTPSKKRVKRKTSKYSDYSSKVDYLFEIAKYFDHEIE